MKRLKRLGLFLVLVGALAAGGCFLFPNLPPEAAFTVNYNTVPGEPLVVLLDASASSSPDGDEIEAYMWTFGDFEEGVEYYPQGFTTDTVYQPIITVKYPVESTYTVTLKVREEKRPGAQFAEESEQISETITLPHD